jgi:hypothetical protein
LSRRTIALCRLVLTARMPQPVRKRAAVPAEEVVPLAFTNAFEFLLWHELLAACTTSRLIAKLAHTVATTACTDLSRGASALPVPCLNTGRTMRFPSFVYTGCLITDTKSASSSRLEYHLTSKAYPGCGCMRGQCGDNCACAQRNASAHSHGPQLFECNANCTCGPTCPLRVMQHGRTVPIAVFWEDGKDWGLKVLGPVPKGSFVASYTGELLSTAAARGRRQQYDRNSLNFLLSIRETIPKRGMVLKMYIDGTVYGNETRFINHSCNPTLELHLVRVDAMVPHVCFFARRAISVGEELTFDYAAVGRAGAIGTAAPQGAGTDSTNPTTEPALGGQRRRCLCGADCCRGYLPFDQDFD